MRILIDTNIILDLALIRHPFYDQADQILCLVEQKQIEGYLSGSAISDLYYIIGKENGKEWALNFLRELKMLCRISPITDDVITNALDNYHKDLEDDIHYYSALLANLDGIVTRNTKDFPYSSLIIFTPDELLSQFSNSTF